MASVALSVVGTAIGGPVGGMIGGMIGGLIDNVLFPVHTPSPPAITTSTYGNAIPLAYGPKNRLGCNMIWSPATGGKSGWRKVTGKNAKLAALKGAPPAYETDVAMGVGAGPWKPSWLRKIWANGNVIFDASLAASEPTPDANGIVTWPLGENANRTHKDFDSLVVYPGNLTQTPDPTIEANLGMGNVAAYIGTAYFVINGLVGTPFGNSVPMLQVLVEAQAEISLGQVVEDIAGRCGLDTTLLSTSSLTTLIRGFTVDSQTDGVTALQPLGLCYDFDIAEVGGGLRFVSRGQLPVCTIENVHLAGHEAGSPRPSFEWPRDAENILPRVAALTFIDPDRDCQANTQSAKRATGSAQSQLSSSVKVTLTSDEGRKIADRMLWEAHIGRQSLSAQTDDRLGYLESAKTYAIEVPFGAEMIRVTKRARGANGVIEFEAKRDLPSLYVSAAPGASAQSAANGIGLGGPVNPPVFIEPPAGFPGFPGQGAAVLMIGLSGGDGVTANDAWGGCNVYVSTDDVTGDYQLVGLQIGPCCMGKLVANLSSFSGSNPDTGTGSHILQVDTSMSDGQPNPQSTQDAADAQTVYLVGNEYLSAQNVASLGSDLFNLSHLWRGLYGTSGNGHSTGDPFVRLDTSVFRFTLASVYIGRELFFRFVSAGESLANATTYSYTPRGVVAASEGSIGNVTASENIAAGALVSLFSNSGALNMRNANATDTTKPADAFVKVAVTTGQAVPAYGAQQTLPGLSGLTPGASYYLDVTAGAITATPPAVTGEGVQFVGKALSASELLFQPGAISAAP